MTSGHTGGSCRVADGGTIEHGLGVMPTSVQLTSGAAGCLVAATAMDARTVTVAIWTRHGEAVTTPVVVYWSADG